MLLFYALCLIVLSFLSYFLVLVYVVVIVSFFNMSFAVDYRCIVDLCVVCFLVFVFSTSVLSCMMCLCELLVCVYFV